MKYLFSLFAILIFYQPAYADITVTEQTLQNGVFTVTGCDDGQPCLCEANIKYPLIKGIKNEAAQLTLNDNFKKLAEQVKCDGPASQQASPENSYTIHYSYEITFQSPQLLAIKSTQWAYEGGAHGNGAIESTIIDLESGKVLGISELLDTKQLADINEVIYKALIPTAQDIFRDEIEKRKTSFITAEKCQGCVLLLDKNGVNVVFQAYEVAPFSSGNPMVAIPAKYSTFMLTAATSTTR